jgi:hypothetical protein
MDYRETLSILLPPPRDDEPVSLRQDIVDELADHLSCAYNREILRGSDSNVAQQRVLQQFGDPAAVARRLWLDAMKGKIMAQRVVIAACLVVMLASLSVVGLIWVQSNRAAAQTSEANRQLAQALAQAQVTNKNMLTELSEMSKVVRSTRSLDWNPVTFKVTEETPDGTPLAGISVTLKEAASGNRGAGTGPAASKPTLRTTDRSGIADFGVVHPGDYAFQVFQERDQEYLMAIGELTIEPGSQVNMRVACPKAPFERAPVRIRTVWPADLETKKLVLYASFASVPIELDGRSWSRHEKRSDGAPAGNRVPPFVGGLGLGSAGRTILCGPATTTAEVLRMKPLFWTLSQEPQAIFWADFSLAAVREIREPLEAMEWERGTYKLAGAVVLRPIESADGGTGYRRYEVLSVGLSRDANRNMVNYFILDKPPTFGDVTGTPTKIARKAARPLGGRGQIGHFADEGSRQGVPWESWSAQGTSFVVRPGPINEYTINVPDEINAAVRESLKRDKAAPSQ